MTNIPLHKIRPNPQQPRQTFDPATLMELARSIHHNGLILPIAVEASPPLGGTEGGPSYILHDGERRWRATCALAVAHHYGDLVGDDGNAIDPDSDKFLNIAEMLSTNWIELLDEFEYALKQHSIRAEIGDPGTSPQDLKIRAVVANEQRDDLNDIDRAHAYQDLHDDGLTDQDIATRVGKSRSTIANLRRLLNLPEQVQTQVATGELSQRQALALAPFHALPRAIYKELIETSWLDNALVNPENHTGDQIRTAVARTIKINSTKLAEVEFPLDQPFEDEKIIHPTCDGCPLRNEDSCFNNTCRHVKHRAWTKAELVRAGQSTGIRIHTDFIPHNEYTEFGGYDPKHDDARDHALETQCDNLVLRHTAYKNTSSPENFPYAIYTCLHGPKSKCACIAHIKQEEILAEKEVKAKMSALRAQVRDALKPLVQQIDPALAVAICGMITYGSLPNPEQAATNLVNKLVNDISDYGGPADFEREIRDWFTERGLTLKSAQDLANDQVRDQLAKIRRWMNTTDADTVDLKAVNGNIENLKQLQAENTDRELLKDIQLYEEILTRIIIDRQAEASIVDRLNEIEAALDDPEIDIPGVMMDLEEILDEEITEDQRQRIIALMDRYIA